MNSQQQAIEKTEGPCIILAGPGTGKTTNVVDKISYLVEQGVCKPSEILCLTFSNEATNAIKTKVLDKLKASAEVEIETFHSFCADVLREEGRLIGIDPGFEILDPDDAKVVFHKYFGISPYYANRYVATIHTAKDFGITIAQIKEYFKELEEKLSDYCHDISKIDEYADNLDLELSTMHLTPSNTPEQKKKSRERKNEIKSFLDVYNEFTKYKEFIDSWEKYDKLKKDKKYQDYADLNFNVLMLFNKYGPKNFSMRYKYVIVDEFQDTNKIQFEIIEHLAAEHRNITIVGDPNQSVYGFRGAYREIFNNFMEAFKVNEKTDVFHLDKSYRSPNSVLKAAHKLITNNYEKVEECFLVQNTYDIGGDNIKLIELKNSAEEARKIAEIVEQEIENGTPMHQICVLFRTHRQGDILRQALESKNIPLAAAGKTDLMQKPEIRTVISFLSIINNLRERTGTGEQAWWSLFHYHNALTPEDSVKIGRYLKNRRNDDISIDEALLTCLNDIKLSQHGEKIVKSLITQLRELVKVSNKALPDLILDIYETSGLNRAFTHRRTTRNTEALMNLKFFYEIAEKYWTIHEKDINGFIKYIEILDDLGVEIQASQITNLNAVRFMTLHAVKGLEFDVVILSNLADDRFPIERTRNEPLIPKDLLPDLRKHIESLEDISEEEKIEAIKDYEREVLLIEERRLCYVGITRTKKRLILTFARSYNDEENSTTASIFLREIGYDNWKEQKTYENIDLIIDNDEKCTIFAPSSSFEQFKSKLKDIIVESLDTDNFQILLSKLITYHAIRDKEIPDYHKLINDNWEEIFDLKSLQEHVNNHNKKISGLKFEPESFVFSPTSLLTYDECPKKYELAHIYQMPERGAFEWSGASTGSFIHKVLEAGVSDGFTSKQQFLDHALKLSKDKEWEGVDLEDINHLIEIFWKRNEGSYNSKSLCEKKLPLKLDAFSFFGIADRIDFLNEKDVRIVDYKTNKNAVDPKSRSWQLGYYALAAKDTLNLNPKQLVLEMLRLEKPFEVELEGSEAKAGRSKGFNLEEVKKELIEAAKKIMYDYEHEFVPVKDDDPCRYCGFKFYCPKWEQL